MTTRALLTMEEIQAELAKAHSKEERLGFLMSLTVKQLKEFAKHQDYCGLMSYMKKADIAEYIIDSYYNSIAWELAECKSYDEVVKFAIRRHVVNDEFANIASHTFDRLNVKNYREKSFGEMALEYSRNMSLEIGTAKENPDKNVEKNTTTSETKAIMEKIAEKVEAYQSSYELLLEISAEQAIRIADFKDFVNYTHGITSAIKSLAKILQPTGDCSEIFNILMKTPVTQVWDIAVSYKAHDLSDKIYYKTNRLSRDLITFGDVSKTADYIRNIDNSSILTMGEISRKLEAADNRKEKTDYLMSLTTKQLKAYAEYEEITSITSKMAKYEIVDIILNVFYIETIRDLVIYDNYKDFVEFADERHITDEFLSLINSKYAIKVKTAKFEENARKYAEMKGLYMQEATDTKALIERIEAAPTLDEKEAVLKELSEETLNALASKEYGIDYVTTDEPWTKEKTVKYIMQCIWRGLKDDLGQLKKMSEVVDFVKKNNLTANEFYRVSGLCHSEHEESSLDAMIKLYAQMNDFKQDIKAEEQAITEELAQCKKWSDVVNLAKAKSLDKESFYALIKDKVSGLEKDDIISMACRYAEANKLELDTKEVITNRINELCHELVPIKGKADTLAGEIVRAVSRINHCYYNNGDYLGISFGYGRETCNPAGRFLLKHGNDDIIACVKELWATTDNLRYERFLFKLAIATVFYIDNTPELRTMETESMYDCRDPEQDVDIYDDEYALCG